jgi:hypothetical protein
VAYTAVKLADVQKAIAAVTAANKKYTDAQASSKTTKTTLDSDKKKLDDALAKLKTLQTDFDNQKYLTTDAGYKTAKTAVETAEKTLNDARNNLNSGAYLTKDTGYQNALKNLKNAEAARDKAYKAMFDPDPKKAKAGEVAYGKETTNIQKAEAALDVARSNAEKTAQKPITDAEKALETKNAALEKAKTTAAATAQKPIDAQQKVVNTNQTTYDTTNEKYQGIINSFDTLVNERNNAVNGVTDYLNNFKSSLGEVTKKADATAAQKLLTDIGKAVTDAKIPDLQKAYDTTTKGWDVMKMAAIPTVNIKDANPDAFANIDPNTKLPILDQGALDAVLDRYKSNKIDEQQYRDNWNKFGWNVKSDASTAVRGPALVGLDIGNIQQGMSSAGRGIVKVGTNQAATDADFKKAAEQLSIKYDDYVKPVKFVPSQGGYGVTEKATAQNSKEYTDPVTGETYLARLSGGKFQTALDKEGIYNAITDRTKDFYLVANSIDGNKHASILFKADGSGNLLPVTNAKNEPFVNYYSATRNVTGQTWYADLVPIAAIAASIALPGIGSAISQSAFGASLAATVGSQVAANAIINATLSAAVSAATGGDPVKAALTAGISTAVVPNIGEMAKAVGVDEKTISSITSTINDLGGKVTNTDVKNIIANGVATAVVTGATDSDKILENVLTSVAGNFADANVKNYVSSSLADSIDRQKLASAADAAGNVANVATNAVISGVDIQTALTNAAPSILASASTAYDNALKGKVALSESELSPDAKKVYDNYVASGIDSSSALVAASAVDPKFKPIEYGRQFGPALAELDLSKLPEVFKSLPKETNLRYVGKSADGRDQYIITDKEGNQGLYTINKDGTASVSLENIPPEVSARAKDTLTFDEASSANVLPPTLKKETGFFDDLGAVISTGTASSFGNSRSLIKKLSDELEIKLEPSGATVINKATGKEITPEQYDEILKAGKIVNGFKFIANDVLVDFGAPTDAKSQIIWLDSQPDDVKQKINQQIAKNVDVYTKQVEQEWNQTPPEQKFNVTPLDVKETLKDYEQSITGTKGGGGGAQQPSPKPPEEVAPVVKPAFKPFESQTFEAIQEALRTSQLQAETALSKAVSSVSISSDAIPNADIVLKQYAKDPAVSDYYISAAKKNFDLMGVQPTGDQISQNAANLYMSDLKDIFAPSSQQEAPVQPSQPSQQPSQPIEQPVEQPAQSSKPTYNPFTSSQPSQPGKSPQPSEATQPSEQPGKSPSQPSQPGESTTQPGTSPTSPAQPGGGTGAGQAGSGQTGTGTGTGSGTGSGSGAGSGAGSGTGTGTGGGVTTITQPSGIASLFGALAPAAQAQPQGGELPLASVFYYGKEFGSPQQKIGPTGEVLQEMYRPLSVSQPGRELAASGEKGENAISALLQSALEEKGDEEDILNILRG